MDKNYLQFITKFLGESVEIKPSPSLMNPLIRKDAGIRAVVFDIYGTILVSASGDIDEFVISSENLKTSLDAAGIEIVSSHIEQQRILAGILGSFKEAIKRYHQSEQSENLPYPEIDILKIWEQILTDTAKHGRLKINGPFCIKCFTFVFEVLSNRVYPMPGMKAVIQELVVRNMPLGIISNAQFYTPIILHFFLHDEVTETETVPPFDPDLTIFSYQHRRSKPDTSLFELLKKNCQNKYDIDADEILFVGNDMFRDIYPACLAGFKTALFAGDTKSLRLRQERNELKKIKPDFIITDLRQILKIIT
jgi:putative hydrolase of the HAD superfamily